MKTKFYYSVFFVVSSFAFISCSSDLEVVVPKDFEPIGDVITMSRDFFVAGSTRALDKQLRLTASYDLKTDKVLDYNIQLVEGDIAKDLDISKEELDQALINELGIYYNDLSALEEAKVMASKDFTLSGCLQGCRDKYTDANGNKIRGRGACRFSCWVERVLVFFERIVDIF